MVMDLSFLPGLMIREFLEERKFLTRGFGRVDGQTARGQAVVLTFGHGPEIAGPEKDRNSSR